MFIKKISNSKNICKFVVLSFINGAEMPKSQGNFFACKDKDVALPCLDRNSLSSSVEELSKGRGGIPHLLSSQTNAIMLKDSTSAIGTSNAPLSAEQIIEDLLLQDDPQRMRMLLRGMADNYLLEENESSFRRASWDCYMALDLLLQRVELLRTEKERRAA
jgi:hypothetical protein